jgi:hypothetical protein
MDDFDWISSFFTSCIFSQILRRAGVKSYLLAIFDGHPFLIISMQVAIPDVKEILCKRKKEQSE